MKTLYGKIFLVIFLLFSQTLIAEELTEAKKQVIDELLEITGALKMGEILGNAVSNQMIGVLSQQNGNIEPHVVEVIKDETAQIMHAEFIANNWINNMSYDLYHKYFSQAEIQELVNFYKTPIGTKVVSVLPQLTQESMLAGQQHAQSLGPIMQERFKARFEKEGIN